MISKLYSLSRFSFIKSCFRAVLYLNQKFCHLLAARSSSPTKFDKLGSEKLSNL